MLQSYHKNTQKHLEYMEYENKVLRENKDKLLMQIAKLKVEKGIIKKVQDTPTPGHWFIKLLLSKI